HTRSKRDWSSDVCSSDLFGNVLNISPKASVAGVMTQPIPSPIYSPEPLIVPDPFDPANFPPTFPIDCGGPDSLGGDRETFTLPRSEERRVGEGCGCGGGR